MCPSDSKYAVHAGHTSWQTVGDGYWSYGLSDIDQDPILIELACVYSSPAGQVQDGQEDKKDRRSLYEEGLFLEKRSGDTNFDVCPVRHRQLEIPLIAPIISAPRS